MANDAGCGPCRSRKWGNSDQQKVSLLYSNVEMLGNGYGASK